MKLNQAQQLAVDTIDGSVMVIAGPGTGKTQIIAERIAKILKKTDTAPDSILALTFTESGAKAMRERLLSTIGETAYYVNIYTFHSFCSSVIQEFPDKFVISPELAPLSALERVEVFHQILDDHQFDFIKPVNSPYYYASSLIKSIQDLKREAIDPKAFKAILKDQQKDLDVKKDSLSKTALKDQLKALSKNKELLTAYKSYQKILKERGRYDFEDMINLVVKAFKSDEHLLKTYQERLHYFLVDEYQDTNSAQNQVVNLLASFWGDQANIFVVGDPSQCLPAGTKITTTTGEKNIEKIKPGEKVLSAVGKGYTSFQKVKRVFKQTKKVKLIILTTKSGKKITCTDNHKMFCFIPPREMTNYWYVYLMYKRNLGWRLGITKNLAIRLKTEATADTIIGITSCKSESEARYLETVYSLKYQIPTVIFQNRGNKIVGKWLENLYQEFDTEKNARKLAQDLGINLNQPHYSSSGTTFGEGRLKINLMMCSRNYCTKYDKQGLLSSPRVSHTLQIQTSDKTAIAKLTKLGFKPRNKNIGKGFGLSSTQFSKLYRIAKKIQKETGGTIDIKASLGTTKTQHRPARVMQAGNLLIGNYLPVIKGHKVIYDKIIKKEIKIKTIPIYDLEVPPSHNFIANKVVVHNSIYRFQGASLENIISFTDTYPQSKIITLDQNYRSTQTILDSSFSLIQKNHLKIEDVIKSAKPKLLSQIKTPGSKIYHSRYPSEILETYDLVHQVKSLIKKGVNPQEIAVIYRHNADAFPLSDMFSKLNIPVDIEGGGDILTDPTINHLLNLFKVIHSTKDNLEDLELFTLFHYPFFNFDPLDVLKLARHASLKQTSMINIIQSKELKKIDLQDPQSFVDFLTNLTRWQQLDARHSFQEFFEKLIKDSGFLDHLLTTPDSVEKLNRLNSLFSEIKRLNSTNHQLNLDSFLKTIELMETNHLKINEQDLDIKSNSVTLTTAHQAKGKEWSHVFIYRLIDKKWGNNQARELIKLPGNILKNTDLSKKEKNEDERRLFYVALTRAKTNIYLSFAEHYTVSGHLRQSVSSMFTHELPPKNLKSVNSKTLPTQAKAILTSTLKAPPPPKSKETAFLKSILTDFKLSPTALNTYLTCPYKFKLNNLVKVPRAKLAYLSYGTAIHSTLEKFYKKFKEEGQPPHLDYLLNKYKTAIKKQVLTSKELKIRLKQGQQTLTDYFNHNKKDFKEPLFIEKYFGGYWSKPVLDDIPLSGKIDRIDLIDKKQKTVKVVDYKTGSPKTRNQILGNTKDSEGDLIRQLTFYKLLTQLDRNFTLVVTDAELDFVEKDKYSGKLKKESFKITSDLLVTLKQEIRTSMKAIRSLNFTRTPKLSHCERCEYQAHCYPNGLSQPEQLPLI